MEKRVKILYAPDPPGLDAEINSFLQNTQGKLIDIKFSNSAVWDSESNCACCVLMGLIIYIPEKS